MKTSADMHTVGDQRWQVAQGAEAEYWQAPSVVQLLRISAGLASFWSLVDDDSLLSACEVLDIGVGPLGLSLASYNPAKVGIKRLVKLDPLPLREIPDHPWAGSFLSWLRQLADEGGYMQLAAEDMAYDETFDTVLCHNVLDHVADPLAVLRRAHAALRHGGRILVGVDCYSFVGRARFEWVTRRRRPDSILTRAHPHSFRITTVTNLMDIAGFSDIAVFGAPGIGRRTAGSHFRPAFLGVKT